MRKYFSILLLVASPVVGSSGENEVAKISTPPVYEGDVDRRYKIVGEIKDNLRKPFAFVPDPSREDILAEIWERGKKLGADAVINARFSETKRTLFNHGKTSITGTAIKYIHVPD